MNRTPTFSRNRLSSLCLALLAAVAIAPAAQAVGKSSVGLDIQVETLGQGRPVLTIPGLNSHASVWRDTCEALKDVQCHLVQLPGFAGAKPAGHDDFLDEMARQVLAYVRRNDLRQPVVIGHSLGGFLALKLALAEPDAIGPLVIVDSLPFFSAAMNPTATSESVKPMAEAVRQQMLSSDDATYQQQAAASVRNMAHDLTRVEELVRWGESSDRATTTQAMVELMVTDLRGELGGVRSPTLVLGAWAGYAAFGQTREATRAIFESQYAALPGVQIELSEAGYHFLMWDDPQWLQAQVSQFLTAHPAKDE
ncbi:alpha/beta hydrolase [Xanthomonadaceae bacterium JHOS43]|nr:alpha/beta hydrolase [Xanthomonadaceae bacterium JHOS43]